MLISRNLAQRSVSTLKATNPFRYVPEDKLRITRDDFPKSEFAGKTGFGRYLTLLHEDDVTPEEMLDIIAGRDSVGGKTFSNAKDLIECINKNG